MSGSCTAECRQSQYIRRNNHENFRNAERHNAFKSTTWSLASCGPIGLTSAWGSSCNSGWQQHADQTLNRAEGLSTVAHLQTRLSDWGPLLSCKGVGGCSFVVSPCDLGEAALWAPQYAQWQVGSTSRGPNPQRSRAYWSFCTHRGANESAAILLCLCFRHWLCKHQAVNDGAVTRKQFTITIAGNNFLKISS